MRIPSHPSHAFPGLALLLAAAGSAQAQPHPADEAFMVWNNGGRVSIEVFKANPYRIYEKYSGGGYKLGGSGGNPAPAFLAGDISGDGRADILHVWNNGGRVSIEGYTWNTGTKRFDYTLGGGRQYGGYTGKFLKGDVNGDGRTDIFQIWNNGGFVSIEGYTWSTETNRFEYTIGGGEKYGPWANSDFLAGDVNGDGKTDILHVRKNDAGNRGLQWYKAENGRFKNSSDVAWWYPATSESPYTFWVAGDFDRSRMADLIKVNSGTPYGYFTYISNGWTMAPSTQAYFTTNSVNLSYSYQYLTADVDGDGDSDLVGPDWYSHNHDGRLKLNVYENSYGGTGRTGYEQSGDLGGSSFMALLSGNVE